MTIYRNISEDGKEETYERLFCSQELTIINTHIFDISFGVQFLAGHLFISG